MLLDCIKRVFKRLLSCTLIGLRLCKVAVNGLNFILTHNRKESIFFVSDLLEILAGRWHFSDFDDVACSPYHIKLLSALDTWRFYISSPK